MIFIGVKRRIGEVSFLPEYENKLVLGEVPISSLTSLTSYLLANDITLSEKEKMYLWIKDVVKDPVLSRKLRNLKQKKNIITHIKDRIHFLTEVNSDKEKILEQVSLNMYTARASLTLDKEKCIRCDVSHTICPKNAIDVNKENITISNKCVLCGVCVPFCPTGALSFHANEEADSLLKKADPLPKMPDFTEINGVLIRKLFEGSIAIDETKCPDDCEECAAACPVGIIERDRSAVKIDSEKCVYCSACSNSCPKSAITVRRNRICHSEGFSSAWIRIVEKLLGAEKVNVVLHQESIEKIKGILKDEDFRGYM